MNKIKKELDRVKPQLDALEECKKWIKASGFSCAQIAKMRGISVQAVHKFMRSASSSTRTIAKYLNVIS
tara:strand:- start:25074 stop:25280 length:207 start_codon:yes stop_codon:yes gene_type:complete